MAKILEAGQVYSPNGSSSLPAKRAQHRVSTENWPKHQASIGTTCAVNSAATTSNSTTGSTSTSALIPANKLCLLQLAAAR